MPSSLIIVALAAAWLVVLVPMIARKRQEVARTTDSALAARVVRVGGTRDEGLEEFAMSDNATPVKTTSPTASTAIDARDGVEAEFDDYDVDGETVDGTEEPGSYGDQSYDEDSDDDGSYEIADSYHSDESHDDRDVRRPPERINDPPEGSAERRYRPGRGGYDPEAAEIAARAKYAYRQRVVLALIVVAIVTAALAGFLWPLTWWGHGAVDLVLVVYLAYLRRQVRIENEIRARRAARLSGSRQVQWHQEPAGHRDRADSRAPERPGRPPLERQRPHRNGVPVDIDDEDPAFHELDEPGELVYRRAVGE